MSDINCLTFTEISNECSCKDPLGTNTHDHMSQWVLQLAGNKRIDDIPYECFISLFKSNFPNLNGLRSFREYY